MTRFSTMLGALAAPILLAACTTREVAPQREPAVSAVAPLRDDACVPPMQMSGTPEETAWKLFVAASCPVNAGRYPYLVWETWVEQDQLYAPPGTPARPRPRFHGSPLAAMLRLQRQARRDGRPAVMPHGATLRADEDCVVSQFGRTICEETRINPEAQRYILDEHLETRAGQLAFVKANKTFAFRPRSVAIKADWIQLATCDAPPANVHVEREGDRCYALAGMHLISKLLDRWIWATFEPQNAETNPRRCLALGCKDTWGSTPAVSSGAPTAPTAALETLMASANLGPAFRNYRLDGVQVDFLDGTTPSRLGNSIIEGESAGTPAEMQRSSCITCHSLSTTRADGRPAMLPGFKTGVSEPLPPGTIARDFVWSLAGAR